MSREILLSNKDFGLKMYNRFPPRYREDDAFEKYALKRYLQACGDGGFAYSIDEWNGILNIQDPLVVDAKILPVLYSQYGFNLFHGIPEEYLRYLLPRLSEAWAKKGSIDVVEFVVSALSGVETETNLWYDSDDNPNLDIKLKMDYALSDYFPDASQFSRIVDAFLPFYLNRTIIYSWFFHDIQKIWLAENYFEDIVRELYPENAFIPFASGTRFAPTVNNMDYLLNSTLITNVMRTFNVNPDWYFDKIITAVVEDNPLVGVEEMTLNEVKILVVHDTQNVLGQEDKSEKLKIEDVFMYYPVLNTDLRLNVDLYTNYGTEDRIEAKADEYWFADKCTLTPYNEYNGVHQDDSNSIYQGLFLNCDESVLNRDYLLTPNIFDKITYNNIGVSVIAFPSLHKYVGAL